jgi:AraC-like DNA-binding protein
VWSSPTVVSATGFVRESIARLADAGLSPSERQRTKAVLCDALRPFPHSGLDLPLPSDSRVRQITEALLDDPADPHTIVDWGREVGASVRNLTRLFSAETGMSFAQWRLHARVRKAVAALAGDATVGVVARSVGYSSTSAFVHAFRRTTGITPATFASMIRLNGQVRSLDSSTGGSSTGSTTNPTAGSGQQS